MKKFVASSLEEVTALIPDGASLMIGGFMAVGTPHRIIDSLVEAGRTGLTVIGSIKKGSEG